MLINAAKTPAPHLKSLEEIDLEYMRSLHLTSPPYHSRQWKKSWPLLTPSSPVEAADVSIEKRHARFYIPGLIICTTVALILCIFTFIGSGSGKPLSIFGFYAMRITSGSMQSEIPEDSLLLIKKISPEDINIGDDITYLSNKESTVTHRVINIYNENGQLGFQTKGIENRIPDDEIVFADDVIGKVVYHSATAGKIMKFINQYIVVISIILLLPLGVIVVIRLYRKKVSNSMYSFAR